MQIKTKLMTCLAVGGMLFGAYAAQADGHAYFKRMNSTTAAQMLPVSGVPAGQWMHMPKSVCQKLCDARKDCSMFVVSDRGSCGLFNAKAVNAAVERTGFTAFIKPYMSTKAKAEVAEKEMIEQAVEDTKAEMAPKEDKMMAEKTPKKDAKDMDLDMGDMPMPGAKAEKKDEMTADENGDFELSLDDLMN